MRHTARAGSSFSAGSAGADACCWSAPLSGAASVLVAEGEPPAFFFFCGAALNEKMRKDDIARTARIVMGLDLIWEPPCPHHRQSAKSREEGAEQMEKVDC